MDTLKPCLILLLIALGLLPGCAVTVGAGAATGAAMVYDRRTTGTVIDDQLIEFKFLDGLRKDEGLWKQTHLNATSYNNVLLLTGEAPDATLKQRAVDLAKRIEKVRQVSNEIVVAAPSSMLSRSSDSWVTAKIKSTMLTTEGVNPARFKVVTENGTVYLLGIVTRQEADAATEIARTTGGVQRVVRLFEYH
ncbi:MAG: BON domain-containing protein [Gammaproteobacteria bacterium]|nr:MAG: BON domain-containing protein [Gammaproteobacteria bacterium]